MGSRDQHLLKIDLEGRILTLTLDRPPKNELTDDLLDILERALEAHDEDTDLVIFTGNGKIFSHGFDLDLLNSWTDVGECRQKLERANRVLRGIHDLKKPTLAAINGPCFGGGLELALACHFRLCVEKARLGLPELSRGVLPGLGGIHRLSRLIGNAKAMEMIALGDLISAGEALRLNLVNRIYPREGFMSHVRSFAKTLLMVDRRLMREILGLITGAPGGTEEDNIQAGIESFMKFCYGAKK